MRAKAILLFAAFVTIAWQPSGAQTLGNTGFENSGGLTLAPDTEFSGAQTYRFGNGETVPGWGTVNGGCPYDIRLVNDGGNVFNNPQGDGMLFLGGGASVFARNDAVGGWPEGKFEFSVDVATWNKSTNAGLSDRPFSLGGRYIDSSGNLLGGQFVISPSLSDPNFTWVADPSGAFGSNGLGPGGLNWRTLNTTFEVDYSGAPVGAAGFDLFMTTGITANDSGHLIDNVNISRVPEPSSGLLVGLFGMLALASRRRR